MKIKEFFKNKSNVAMLTFTLILLVVLTLYIATSYSKYVLEKEVSFNLEIIESDEWNKRTLITGQELNTILKQTNATQVVFGYEEDYLTEIENLKGTAVGTADEEKEFNAEDIKLYTITNGETTIAYILSEYQIKANADSSEMFKNYATLTDLYLYNFETSIVENMNSMFYGCESLTTLDLYKFDTANVTDITSMFYDCSSLTTIYVSELWDLPKITTAQENVFSNCASLIGGNNTAYDTTKISSKYACIDTGAVEETPAIPGYFTYKSKDIVETGVYKLENTTTETTDNNEDNSNNENQNEANTNTTSSNITNTTNSSTTNTTTNNTHTTGNNNVDTQNTTNTDETNSNNSNLNNDDTGTEKQDGDDTKTPEESQIETDTDTETGTDLETESQTTDGEQKEDQTGENESKTENQDLPS